MSSEVPQPGQVDEDTLITAARKFLNPRVRDSLGLRSNREPRYTREEAAQRWAANCAGVDEVAQAMAASVQAEYQSDEIRPDIRGYGWREGQTCYVIRMLLSEPEQVAVLRVFSDVWFLDETRGVKRSFLLAYGVDLDTPVRPRVLQGTLDGLMKDIRSASTVLTQPVSPNNPHIIETPLPKTHPRNKLNCL